MESQRILRNINIVIKHLDAQKKLIVMSHGDLVQAARKNADKEYRFA